MCLRKVCRELVLEVLLPGALSKSIDGDSGRLQLVVDTRTMRVLGSFLLMSDLHSEGVTSMELLERAREPLPALDALYFVRATSANVELIRGDFQTGGPDAKGEGREAADTVQHRHVHLAFSQMLTTELMEQLAEAPRLSQRVKSMVELPLSFVTVQDRGFHFDMPSALRALFPAPDPLVLGEVVHGLVDVCRCLQAEEVSIRHLHSKTCKEVAKRLEESLAHSSKRSSPLVTGQRKAHIPCEVLIVDRSFDMASPLVHEYTYEAMVYDLLDGGALDADRNVVTMKSPDREMLLSEVDALWEELKHMHLGEALSTIPARTQEVLSQNRRASPDQVSTKDLLGMVRDLPGQKDVIDRLMLHTFIAQELNRRIDEEQLMPGEARQDSLGLLEQDIACGHDRNGKTIRSDKLHENLVKFFNRGASVPSETKLRLLLLYLSCVAYVKEDVRQRLVEAANLSADDQVVLMNMLQTQLADVPDHTSQKPGASCVHRVTDDQAACFKANAREEGRFELSRYEPRVKLILRQLLEGRLPDEEFPHQTGAPSCPIASAAGPLRAAARGLAAPLAPPVAAVDDWSFAGAAAAADPAAHSTAPGVTRRVLVFVLGGITYSELRAVAELKRELPAAGLEVVLGGTSLLTARRLIDSLRPPREEEPHGAARGPQEEAPRPSRAGQALQSALSLA